MKGRQQQIRDNISKKGGSEIVERFRGLVVGGGRSN